MRLIVYVLIVFVFFSCEFNSASTTQSSPNKILIGERVSLSSKVLNEERGIFVSLPQNYHRNIQGYPVIIVLDAEYLFEITSSIVKIKASRNEMPESIIIGIPNNTGKRYEMALDLEKSDGQKFFGKSGGKSKDYLEFFRDELFPFLSNNYRVNDYRTIIGMSPTFGPVLEGFWNEPDLFSGYIILAAELSLKTTTGETVAQRLLTSMQDQDSLRHQTSLYIGKAAGDLNRRPPEEVNAFVQLNEKLESIANPSINYKIEILENEDHYGMSIAGIKRGLETIYPKEVWQVPYRDFWNSEDPANELKSFYANLSERYGFEIVPLEDSFYAAQTLLGTLRRLERQGRNQELEDFLSLAIEYYPNSNKLINLIFENSNN